MARVLITGCSTGFGRASAVELTKRGHDVVATARTSRDARRPRRRRPSSASTSTTTRRSRRRWRRPGTVDALVNNAGFGVVGPIEQVPIAEAGGMFETNVFGDVRMIQAVAPADAGAGERHDRQRDVARRPGRPRRSEACTRRRSTRSRRMSEALHYEVGHFGVRVRLVEPGFFATEFQGKEPRFGLDGPPYDELDRQWAGRRSRSSAAGRAARRRSRWRRSSPTRSRAPSGSCAGPWAPTPTWCSVPARRWTTRRSRTTMRGALDLTW